MRALIYDACMTTAQTAPIPAIRLRADTWTAWASSEDLASEAAQARRIGHSQTTLNRILRGKVAPGEKFIAAALAATGMKFEDLFETAPAQAS
jgi:lambda repressor-like predicted transcriptional regulator